MTSKRKKITKFPQSDKEINQIYQSIHNNWMRQAHKEMNPATAAALLWSDQICLMQCW
jgi:hypothetical protein